MRVADYIFKFLADHGVKHVFLVTGGGAMHLNDALGREKRIRYVCNLHEQACAIAAEGYARITGQPGVLNVTTGPGGTNAVTGVMGAWVDSIPMFVISGQVKTQTTISACPELHLRQLGDQEINIVDIVRPITKYAVMLTDPKKIRAELEFAWRECQSGRPGPVWLDVPLDIQAAEVEETELDGMEPGKTPAAAEPDFSAPLAEVVEQLRHAERPVILAGIGVRHGNGVDTLLKLAENCHIPVLTSISGIDLIASDHPMFFGRPGILGERAANFILQNSDFLLVLGTRMGIRVCGYDWKDVAREAWKIMVDVDGGELNKPTFRPDLGIQADAGKFLRALSADLPSLPERKPWLEYCRRLRRDYPVVLPEHRSRTDYVSSYVLPEMVAELCSGNEIVVTGNGTAYTSTFQAFPLKKGMRMFANEGCAAMGYDLPAAVGAAFAGNGRKVILFTGDGSLMMNVQELQTIATYRLPVKILVYSNEGYLSIKLTQNAYFNGRHVGSDPASGVVLPDLEKLTAGFQLPFVRMANHAEAAQKLPDFLAAPGPGIAEILCDPLENLGPKAASRKLPDGRMVSAPLEDLAPFLPREEFRKNMIVKPVENSEFSRPAGDK